MSITSKRLGVVVAALAVALYAASAFAQEADHPPESQ